MLHCAGCAQSVTFGVFFVLACLAQLAVVAGAGLVTWRLFGSAAAIAMGVGLSALSVADKSIEYACIKQQMPLLGAVGLWCVIAVGLGFVTVLQIAVCSLVLFPLCVLLVVLVIVSWCVKCVWPRSHEWCTNCLEAAGQGVRDVWKLPGDP